MEVFLEGPSRQSAAIQNQDVHTYILAAAIIHVPLLCSLKKI